MESNDKPFKCPNCGQCFANSDHLAVHQLVHFKHQKSLQVKIPGLNGKLTADQTPTPTRFLRTADVDGSQLFEEINPFDQDFKLASTKRQLSTYSSVDSASNADQNPAVGSTTGEDSEVNAQVVEVEEQNPSSSTDNSKERHLKEGTEAESSSLKSQSVPVIASKLSETSSVAASSTESTPTNLSSSNAVIQAVLKHLQQARQNTTVAATATVAATPILATPSATVSAVSSTSVSTAQKTTSSQDFIREQLAVLLKSGQIKIQIAPDPSSPKVQATIVGNVPVKASTFQQQSVFKQQQSRLEPLLIPKTTSTVSQESVITPISALLASVSPSPSMVQTSHQDANLALAKQKLKQVIQQNTNGEHTPVFTNRVLLNTQSSQGKYKDIKLENHPEFEIIGSKRKKSEEMTPEDKRNKFLERNRAAASRCRQKRKIWVNQLEKKSDGLVQTNGSLLSEIGALRSEVAQLKALLLAHKDCPVTLQQKALIEGIQITGAGAYVSVSDGQIIAIHQVGSNGVAQTRAEEVASSALTDMASRGTIEVNTDGTVTVASDGSTSTIANNALQR